jgi:hypothetical protein
MDDDYLLSIRGALVAITRTVAYVFFIDLFNAEFIAIDRSTFSFWSLTYH